MMRKIGPVLRSAATAGAIAVAATVAGCGAHDTALNQADFTALGGGFADGGKAKSGSVVMNYGFRVENRAVVDARGVEVQEFVPGAHLTFHFQ